MPAPRAPGGGSGAGGSRLESVGDVPREAVRGRCRDPGRARGGAHDPDALPERGGDPGGLRRRGGGGTGGGRRRGRGDGRRQWQHRRVAGTGAGRRGAGGRRRRPWLRQRAGRRHRRRARPVRPDRRRRRLLRLRRVAEVPGATAWWRGSGHGLPPAGRRGPDPARGHALDAPLDRQPDPERPWPPVLHRIESTTSIAACAPSGATPSWGWGCNARAWSSPRRWWCGRASPAWRWPRCR